MNKTKNTLMSSFALITSCIMALYVFAMNSLHESIPEIAIGVLAFVLFLFLDNKKIYFIVAMTFVLDLWIPYTFVVLAGAAVLLMRSNGKCIATSDIFLIALFALLQVFSMVAESLDLVVWVKVAISLVAQVYLFKSIETQDESIEFSKGIMFGFLTLAITTLLYATQNISLTSIILHFRLGSNTLERWLSSGVIIPNENNLARACVFAITVSFSLKDKKAMTNFGYLIFNIFAVVVLLLTQSRSGLLLLAVAYAFYYLMSSSKNIGRKLGMLVGAFVIVLIVYIVIIKFMPDLFNSIAARFQDDDLSNGRWENALYYHEQWTSKLRWIIFGFGDQNVSARFSHYNSVHSALQAYFVHYGIVGATAFFAFLIKYVKNLSHKLIKPTPITAWLPFIVVCIGKLFGAMNTTELLVSAVVSMNYSLYVRNDELLEQENI